MGRSCRWPRRRVFLAILWPVHVLIQDLQPVLREFIYEHTAATQWVFGLSLRGCCSLRNDVFAAACLFAGKKKSTWGNICQFEMLFVQFTLQRSGPNWPFFRGAMMEQSPALRAMTEAGARRRKIEALKAQMEHLKEELQMVVAVEILMRQEYHNLDSALDLIEEFRNGRQQLFIDSERGRDFSS